jgi:hypothetical protein
MQNIEKAFWEENKMQSKEIVSSENDRLRYYCYGQIKSIHPIMIDCGTINFPDGEWTNDESTIGSYVYFVISRLDIEKIY